MARKTNWESITKAQVTRVLRARGFELDDIKLSMHLAALGAGHMSTRSNGTHYARVICQGCGEWDVALIEDAATMCIECPADPCDQPCAPKPVTEATPELPCTFCLSTDHKPGTRHAGQDAIMRRPYTLHDYRAPARWWYFTETLTRGSGWASSYGHDGKTLDKIRDYARELLATYPAVIRVRIRVRIRIAYRSPEHKPSTTQEYTATTDAVEVIARFQRCDTVGHADRVATHRATYNYRGEQETTTDLFCESCATSYARRPVLVNFTATPIS